MPNRFDLSMFTSLTPCEYHYLPTILSSQLCTRALCIVLCAFDLFCMPAFFIWNIKFIKWTKLNPFSVLMLFGSTEKLTGPLITVSRL